MKAWVLHDVNDIRLETVGMPVLESGQVLVAVKSVGICGSDIPRIYRTGAHRHPLIPGHEFSGVVEALGKDVDSGWLGKRVGIFPLIPCKTCVPCRKGQYEMCRNYDYLGSRRDGGFAEYVAVPEDNLIKLPDNVSFAEAAMLEPMAVAVHAMRRGMPEIGRELTPVFQACQSVSGIQTAQAASGARDMRVTVAVCGLGTIGLLLVMLLSERKQHEESTGEEEYGKVKKAGERAARRYRILAIGNKEFQRQRILEMGIPEECYCDSRKQDVRRWLMDQTEGCGVDVFFECVGKNVTLEQAVENTAPGGRVCLVGNPDSDMLLEKAVYWKILRNQLIVTGTWNSSFAVESGDDWTYVLERLAGKRITPERLISHSFSLEELEQGFRIMRDKSEDYVKIMGVL